MIIAYWYGGCINLIKKNEFQQINENWVKWKPATKKQIILYNKGIREYFPKSLNIEDGCFGKWNRFESNYFSQEKSWNLRARAKRALKIAHKMGYYDIEQKWCKYLHWISKKEVKKQRISYKKIYRS